MKVAVTVDESYPVYHVYSMFDVNRDIVVIEVDEWDYNLYMAITEAHRIMQDKIATKYRRVLAEEESR